MGKKVYNARARQNPHTVVDNSAVRNIRIELDDVASSSGAGYDAANALVLPSRKRATKVKVVQRKKGKILTKKQRKHLVTIIQRKEKKEARAGLLEALATVQVPESELQQYTSISQVQTLGVKKLQNLDEVMAKKQSRLKAQQESEAGPISSIKGAGKRKLLVEDEAALEAKRRDPSVVGMSDEDSDSDSDSEYKETTDEDSGSEYKETTDEEEDVQTEKTIEETTAEPIKKDGSDTAKPPTSQTEEAKPKVPVVTVTAPSPAVFVPVHRDPEIQAARLKLPILAEEQLVMETINENNIVIIAGETGSGKTTQLPQFLYESGYARSGKLIGVTEPRRVAAIAMSKRVAREMNLSEREVSYLIRFEGNVTPETRIKFMTDGVLLKEIESDFLLHNYSVIILDEAHERSAYTDILVGLLSRIVPLRQKRGDNPLKLIVMSATLRVEDFTTNTRLFKSPPPLLKVEARQFPVTIHFQKHTPDNYVDEAYRKTLKIHGKLPEGGILIFLTGQLEVNQLVRKLRRTFPYVKQEALGPVEPKQAEEKEGNVAQEGDASPKNDEKDDDIEFDMKRAIRNVKKSKKRLLGQIALPKINLDDYKLPGDDTEADLHDMADDSDDDAMAGGADDDDSDLDVDASAEDAAATRQPLWVLPLYSLLSSESQNRIFEPPPAGCRLCIVTTNVAETSLTIPNIKYVVDSGRQKTRLYDKITGVSAFVVTYTSKASAEQRAGRAGRVSAGHCYRLYSSAVYNDSFPAFDVPDIQKKPVDDLMLQMRCMGIDRVLNFPFPSPPDVVQLQAAEQRLIVLGALAAPPVADEASSSTAAKKDLPPIVTKLGHVIARFPVAPRFGKMLALSHQKQLLPYTVCLVAALSVQEILLEVNVASSQDDGDEASAKSIGASKWLKKRQSWAAKGNFQLLGDPMVLLRAVGAAEFAGSEGRLSQFCADNGLRLKAVTEVRKLRIQLTNEINLNVSDAELCVDPAMTPPNDTEARFLRQILLAGMGDRVARKVPLADIADKEERRRLRYAYNCLDMEEPAFMHASSVLRQELPEWVVYQEAYETRNGDATKMFIRGITAIEPEWLLLYVPLLCNVRVVKEDPLPTYRASEGKVYCHVDATFGKAGWQLPLAEIEMPEGEKAYCYFGMFLLEGVVCPKLAQYKPKLKTTPASLVKSWSNLNEGVVRFKRALISRQINTRQKLLDEWQRNPEFLLQEYHYHLYNVALAELSAIWPPVED